MKKIVPHVIALSTLVLLFTAGAALSAGVDMREGEWEITTETSMTMGTMSMPSMSSKVTHCLTREDPVPTSEKEKDCKIVDQKVSGNKVSWRMVCKEMEGEGEITYSGTTYKGTFSMRTVEGGGTKKSSRKKSSGDGEAMTMNMKLSGRYLGACPKGQKSGPTGETAKKVAEAEQMKSRVQQQQAEQAAAARKSEAFIKRAAVPAEEKGACAQEGFASTKECEEKVGKLKLNPGEFEITVEQVTRMGPSYSGVETKRSKVCVTEDNPVPGGLFTSRSPAVKRGKERITWTEPTGPSGGTSKGGISYRGDSFEGAVTQSTDLGSGYQSLIVKKVTGRRTGDGNCVGRGGPGGGLDYTAKKRQETGEKDKEKEKTDVLKNPVKGIRNLFGF